MVQGVPRRYLSAAPATGERFNPLFQRQRGLHRPTAIELDAETFETQRARSIDLRIVVLGAESIPSFARAARGT